MHRITHTHTGFPGGSVIKKKKIYLPRQETWVKSLGWEDPLENGMTTHSSIQSMESLRVGDD